MSHLHYSPFQFSTAEQTQEPRKLVVAQKDLYMKMCEKRKQATRDLGTTFPSDITQFITSSPNAYICPNPPDVRRHCVFNTSR